MLRLNLSERGLPPPAAFASALDAPRLARRIGCFVLESALAQAETWHRQGLPLRVSVNVSTYHLFDQEFLSDLQTALGAHTDLPASAVEIEITETYLQKLPVQTIKIDQSFVRNILHDPKDHAC